MCIRDRFVLFSVLQTDKFLAPANLQNLLQQIVTYMIIGCGLTFCLVCGGNDLSAGASMALSGIIVVSLLTQGLPIWPVSYTHLDVYKRQDSHNVIIEVVKPAYDGRGLIVRLYENFNRTCDAKLKLCVPVKAAFCCDMLEQDAEALEEENGDVRLHVKPYEILTVRVLT